MAEPGQPALPPDVQPNIPDELNASPTIVTVAFLEECLKQLLGDLVEMLDERARPHSPPASATIPRPPSEHEKGMSEGEDDDVGEQDLPQQEQVFLEQSAAQQPRQATPPASATNPHGGQANAPSYPTWLTPPEQLVGNSGSVKPAAKARLPDAFEPGKIDLRQWLFQMDNYFSLTRTSDVDRVPYAAQLLKGSAMSWWIGLLGQLAAPGSTVPPITGWEDVKTRLYAQFASVNPHKEARVKLDTLRQANSVQDYINRFNKLAMDIPMMTQEEMIYRFEQGLKPRVQAEMAKMEFPTLTALFAAAQKFDAISWRASSSTGDNPSSSKPNYGSSRLDRGKAPSPHQLSALDLLAIQAVLQGTKQARTDHKKKKPQGQRARQAHTLAQVQQTELSVVVQRPAKLTPEEKEHLAKNNGCFRCRQLGHNSYNCPTFPSTQGNGQRR